MPPKISVVVPFYNVEKYLDECLASVAQQTLADLEVIMVDDGSPDGSVEIARAWAERDSRFVLVRQENQGLGPARNTGVRHATGEYLAFMDSDDKLPLNACELLVGTLDATGSDFASGGVLRFNSQGTYPSGMHRDLFKTTRRRTHVSREPDLLQDRIACNKVFRRSFWDRHGFAFPPGRYEDIPVTIPAHAHASSVDILRHPVYLYRARDDGNDSITQQRTDPGNMEDRVASVISAGESLRGGGFLDLKRAYDRRVLEDDFTIFVNVLPRADEEYRKRFCAKVAAYVDQIDPTVLDEMTSLNRLRYHLLLTGRTEELLEVVDRGRALPEAVPRGRHWYGLYPYFDDPDVGVPHSVYRLDQELSLQTKVTGLTWSGQRLIVEGRAHINLIGAPTRRANRISLRLRHTKLGIVRSVPVERFADPGVTAEVNQPKNYDWAAFRAAIDLRKLKIAGRLLSGSWEVVVSVAGRHVRRRGALHGSAPGSPKCPEIRFTDDFTRVVPMFEPSERFLLRVEKRLPIARESRIDGDFWEVGCELPATVPAVDPVLEVSRRIGSKKTRHPMTARTGADGRTLLIARIPLADLAFSGAASPLESPAEDEAEHGDGGLSQELDWQLHLLPDGPKGARQRIVVANDFTESRVLVRGKELCLTRTRYGNLIAVDRLPRLVVHRHEWTATGALRLDGEYAGPKETRPTHLLLRKRLAPTAFRFPIDWSADGFSVELDPADLDVWGTPARLPKGSWDLLTTHAGAEVPVMVSRTLSDPTPLVRETDNQTFTLLRRRLYELTLRVRPNYDSEERGTFAQSKLREGFYAERRTEPLRDMVLFESYFGRQYSCNPRAIYEELRRRGTDLELVWATADGSLRIPDGGRTVLIGSREHMTALARAKFIVSNCGIQPWYVKREGQFYLQTWHGSPLKRIGLDVETPSFERGRERMRLLAEDAQKWDLMLSQSAFVTPILRRAMAFSDGEIAELGYPRNDTLHDGDVAARRRQARARLGLPEGRKVILYAPTWRDDGNKTVGSYQFELALDVEAMRERLGDEHVLLLRLHHLINRHGVIQQDDFVRDVSTHPDVNELCLAADVLITDYSSLLFDYAGTGRPLLLYTYDYERYRDTTRGLSFDLEKYAPGPLLRTSEEVIGALGDLESFHREHRAEYDAFRARFCPHEDGAASSRVVDRLLEEL